MIRRRALAPVSLAFLALLIGAGLGAVSAAVGPSASWSFDETNGPVAHDGVGALDGAMQGVTSVADGAVGRAFRFDGSARVSIPDAPVLRADIMNLDFWIRADPDDPPADGQVVLSKGTALCSEDGHGYALTVDGKSLAITYRDRRASTGLITVRSSQANAMTSLWDGDWHHVTLGNYARSDGWGSVDLRTDGWWVASGPYAQVEGIDHGPTGAAPLIVGADAAGCGPGFDGDIDQLRAFDRVVSAAELYEDEPVVATSLSIDDIEPVEVDATSTVDVTLLPAPARPGWIRVYATAEDGVERGIGALEIRFWELTTDGRYRIALRPDYGGVGTIRVRYIPDDGEPRIGSQDSVQVDIAKRPSSTTIGQQTTYIADEPIRLGITAHVDRPVTASGTAELYEILESGPVLIHAGPLIVGPGTFQGGMDIVLPGRPAGTYRFEARYLGSASYLPSVSPVTTVTIGPALDIGEITINGGASSTDDPVVTLSAPATGAIGLWISTDLDDIRRFYTIPYAGETTVWLTAPWYGDDRDGVRTIWVRWADILGRWSDTRSASILLDRGLPAGSVSIAAGAEFTLTHDVSVAVTAEDPGSASVVELSNDGKTWSSIPYAPSVPWTLAPGDGPRTVHVRWRQSDGRTSISRSDSIIVDSTAPTVSAPSLTFLPGGISTTDVPTRVSWYAKDVGSGIGRFELQMRTNGGSWSTLTTSLQAASWDRRLSASRTYEFRVRAVDRAGRVGSWVASAARRLVATPETSSRIAYRGTWDSGSSSSYRGGRARYAAAAGRTATFSFTGRSVAWLSAVGPTRGVARVYVNGTFVRSVDLHAAKPGASRIVFEHRWASNAARTITIRVVGTPGHGRVDVDGFLTLGSP